MNSEALERILQDEAAKLVYLTLLAHVRELGEFDVQGKKTSIHLNRKRAFIGVSPRVGGIVLNLVTTDALDSSRLRKTEQLSARRFHSEIVVRSVDDFDEELLGWIDLAYTECPE